MALFQKGNQFGRRKGKHSSSAQKLAEKIRRVTKNGKLIYEAALQVMADPKARAMERIKAAELLKESGWGLASRGGETEDGKGNILINVVYYAKPPAVAEPNSGGLAHNEGTEVQRPAATQPAEEPSTPAEEGQTGAGGTHRAPFGSRLDGATGGKI